MTVHDTTDGGVRRARLTASRAADAGRRGFVCALLAAAIAACTGCAIGDDGPQTTQERSVARFTRVENRTSVHLRVRVVAGQPQHVRVIAGRKLIGDVGTKVHDGTLEVTFDHDSRGIVDHDVVVEASIPRLVGIDTSGSGDVDADGIRARAFAIRSDGSGDIALHGRADRLAVALTGSGGADLADLTARRAHVTVGGSGGVDVRATERLDVAIDGSGDVRYHDHPLLRQRIDGSGGLSQAG